MQKRFFPFLSLIFVIVIWAPFVQSQPSRLQFQHLSKEDGLSQSYNSYLYKDSKGFMWISSMDGLNRYDGQNIKVYQPDRNQPNSLSGNIINSSFFEDDSSNLWFVSYDAINCYRREKDHFNHFRLKDENGQLIGEDYYAFHLDEEKNLWVRTGHSKTGRLHLFNILTYRDTIISPLDGYRCSVVKNESGMVRKVISCMMPVGDGFEIRDYENKSNTGYKSYFRAPSKNRMHITAVFPEQDSLYWLATGEGLLAFDPITQAQNIYSDYHGEKTGKVWAIQPYQDRYLFISTVNTGLYLFDKISRTFVQRFQYIPEVRESLIKNSIQELYLDNHENLWVTMWTQGLEFVNLKKNRFPILLNQGKDNRAKTIHAISEDEQANIWCGTNKGVYVFNQKKEPIAYFNNDDQGKYGFNRRVVYFIEAFSDNRTYISCGSKLFTLSINPEKVNYLADVKSRVHFMKQLSTGSIMVATEKGIFEVSTNNRELPKLFPGLESKSENSYTYIYEDRKNQLYLSENAENLLIYQLYKDRIVFKKRIPGLGYCKSFLESDNEKDQLWIATTRGLLKLNTTTFEFRLLNQKTDGIPSETYYSVLPDKHGNLWLSSNNGLVKYAPKKKVIHRFSKSDGLQDSEFNTNAFCLTSKGEMWFGGGKGVNVFHPDDIDSLTFMPDIQFTRININDEPDSLTVDQREKTIIRLPYHQNTLSFEFVGMDYSDVDAVKYQYRMLGYDRNWVPETRRGFARYPNLPPGDYTFQVRATNSDGVWTPHSKDLRIYIRTPFWKTWWFYLICLAIAIGILYTWFRYRLEQVLKIERMRVKISSDLHDDVGTLLSGLAMQSELLELTATTDDKPRLQRIGEMSRSAMSRMRDTVWAIDARKDKFENLLDRMREHAEETLSAKDISFRITTDSVNLKMDLPSQVRQNIYLIYKEAITNIAKHSNADQVQISLKQSGKTFEMKVHDNGSTVEKTYKTTGLGSENMNMRAEQINGQLKVNKITGYEVCLRVPDLLI